MKINELLKKYEIKPNNYIQNGNVTIIDTSNGKFVIKKKNTDDDIITYLKSRSFTYYPNVKISDDDYEITEYIDDLKYPVEQKMTDMINLVSLLHNKTTFYKETDIDDYKKIYEDINNDIDYLNNYYNDLINNIDTHVFMSPSQYYLARNIAKIYSSLDYCKVEIDNWYKLVENSDKQRYVVIHNNLDLSHFIKNDSSYLISWDKSKIGLPIFDLYILYKRHGLDFDFDEILKEYESNYPLKDDEKKLLFVLIMLPEKIEFNQNEYLNTLNISKKIDLLYKTEKLVLNTNNM